MRKKKNSGKFIYVLSSWNILPIDGDGIVWRKNYQNCSLKRWFKGGHGLIVNLQCGRSWKRVRPTVNYLKCRKMVNRPVRQLNPSQAHSNDMGKWTSTEKQKETTINLIQTQLKWLEPVCDIQPDSIEPIDPFHKSTERKSFNEPP